MGVLQYEQLLSYGKNIKFFNIYNLKANIFSVRDFLFTWLSITFISGNFLSMPTPEYIDVERAYVCLINKRKFDSGTPLWKVNKRQIDSERPFPLAKTCIESGMKDLFMYDFGARVGEA